MTTIYLMRHAPTQWNREQRIQGNTDTDIIPDEIEAYFKRINAQSLPKPDLIIVSHLKRTRQTAEALITYNHWQDVPIYQHSHTHERRWGVYEGKTLQDIDEVAHLIDTPHFRVEGGESMEEVRNRIKKAIDDICKNYRVDKILIVTHRGVLTSLGLGSDSYAVIKPPHS